MLFFQKYIDFIDSDNRHVRPNTPVNAETLTYKHEAMSPREVVEGKTILDLGSCLGATGHWCLSHGAISYTGVEFQTGYVEKSNELLGKYWPTEKFKIVQDEIEKFLENTTEQYDVVFASGVLYGFLNTHRILELITKASKSCVIIDSSYPTDIAHWKSPIIEITLNQHMIRSDWNNGSYQGLGARPSPSAVYRLMKNLGFENRDKKLIFPKRLEDPGVHDAYHDLIVRKYGIKTPSRFILRFYREEGPRMMSVVESLTADTNIVELPLVPPLLRTVPQWEFDKSVADRFQQEAEQHIPDYQKVIDLEIDIIERQFQKKDIKIIDVGSALGHTLDNLHNKGFTNIVGVECSKAMIEKSKHKEKIIYSDKFPSGTYDVVLANWTVHFIKEKEKYLSDIYNSLTEEGILILTDKMTQHPLVKEMYYDFKRSNGVPENVIQEKEQKLEGIMLSMTMEFYLEVLYRIGFVKVDLINSRYNFNTLLCFK